MTLASGLGVPLGLWREKSYTSLRLPLESGRPKLPLVGVSLLVFLRASPLAQSLLSFAKGLLAAFPSCGGASESCYYVRAPLQLVEHPGTTSWCPGNVNGAAKPFFVDYGDDDDYVTDGDRAGDPW